MSDEVVTVFLTITEYCKWERIYSSHTVVNYNVAVAFSAVCVKHHVSLPKNSTNTHYMYHAVMFEQTSWLTKYVNSK